jgi:hypothetical protein
MLTLQFVPYTDIETLSSAERINKILNIAKENKIVLLEGRLKKEEEGELIKTTMEEINDNFKGIELQVIYPKIEKKTLFLKIKSKLINAILGNRNGFTIIGPASVVKEIKNNPDNIELLTQEQKRVKTKRNV